MSGSSKLISAKFGTALNVGADISMSKSVGIGKSVKDSTGESGTGWGAVGYCVATGSGIGDVCGAGCCVCGAGANIGTRCGRLIDDCCA